MIFNETCAPKPSKKHIKIFNQIDKTKKQPTEIYHNWLLQLPVNKGGALGVILGVHKARPCMNVDSVLLFCCFLKPNSRDPQFQIKNSRDPHKTR